MPSIFPSQPVFYGGTSREGARYVDVPVSLALPGGQVFASATVTIDAANAGMSTIQAGKIDNSLNYSDLYITFQDSGDTIRIPAYSITSFPIYTSILQLQCSVYSDSIFSTMPFLNNISIRVYNFALTSYDAIYTWGRKGSGFGIPGSSNPASPGLPPPFASPNVYSIPATNVPQLVLQGYRTRYKYSISTITSGTFEWQILTEQFGLVGSYVLIAGFVGAQNPWVEQQALPDQPITKSAIYVRSTTAMSIIAAQWTSSNEDNGTI